MAKNYERICWGEFDWPDESSKRSYLRHQFLGAVHKHVPEVFDDLRAKVFGVYRRTRSANPNPELSDILSYLSRLPSDLTPPLLVRPAYDKLYRSLIAWANSWNLVGPGSIWVLDAALTNLEETHSGKILDCPVFCGMEPAVPEPPDRLLKYDPLAVTRNGYLNSLRAGALEAIQVPILKLGTTSQQRAHIKARIVREAEKYCDGVEQAHKRAGYPRCRVDEKRNLDRDLLWTVRLQLKVANETASDIAKLDGVATSTVLRQVQDILDEIGLERRPDIRQGRRHGSKNSVQSKILRELGC